MNYTKISINGASQGTGQAIAAKVDRERCSSVLHAREQG